MKQDKERGRERIFGRNFLRDIIFLGDRFNALLLKKNAARGHKEIRMSYAPVLLHVAKAGTRATDIAARTGLTKQAIGKTVGILEGLGYLRQEIDPQDARNRNLHFTARGEKLIADTVTGVGELEQELEKLLGQQRARDLIDTVALLVDKLQAAEAATGKASD